MSDENLARTIIEYALKECDIFVEKQLDKDLRDIFSKVPSQSISLEAKIARFVQKVVMKVKTVEKFSHINDNKFMYYINLEIINATKENGKLTFSTRLDELFNNLIIEDIPLPKEVISKMMQSIDNFDDNEAITRVCKYTTLQQKRDF
ncbi:MAG: hypothetical protein LUF02_02810 [Erysipelotrichaceae bacterium]|nr:hypothetical protein [Erysipelotrichaceae bacterium]